MPILLLAVLLICISVPSFAGEKPVLTFAYVHAEDHPQTIRLVRLVTEAARRVGYGFRFKIYPPKRASLAAIRGIVDGELLRVKNYGVNRPTMVRVEEYHTLTRFIAYTTDPKLKLHGWDSLKGRDLSVDHRMGVVATANSLSKVVLPENLHVVGTHMQAFERMFRGRSDIYIDTASTVEPFLKSEQFRAIAKKQPVYQAGQMQTVSGHVWLNEKHRDLAPKFSAAFKAMKREVPHFFKTVWE